MKTFRVTIETAPGITFNQDVEAEGFTAEEQFVSFWNERRDICLAVPVNRVMLVRLLRSEADTARQHGLIVGV